MRQSGCLPLTTTIYPNEMQDNRFPGKQGPLKRGSACLTCRFLKIRCDGRRPICGPCYSHPKHDPCEYTDKPGRSRYRNLEDTIAVLQSRVLELETDQEVSTAASNSTSSSNEEEHFEWSLEDVFRRMLPPNEVLQSTQIADGTRTLFSLFEPYASQFGFFLEPDHFAKHATLPVNDPGRPCEVVISAVCLWGCHLSSEDSPFRQIERLILAVALHEKAVNLLDHEVNPRRVLHSIQAEVLLSYYFYRRGTLIEAKAHAASAASLATGSGLASIYELGVENQPYLELEVMTNGEASYLPSPRNIPETGELINCFWAVYILEQQLTSASTTSHSTSLFDAAQLVVDCPWPLEYHSYREGFLPHKVSNTIDAFLRCPSDSPDRDASGDSFNTMVAKTTVLLRHATILADSIPWESVPFAHNPIAITTLISDYRNTLPKIELGNTSIRSLYLANAQACSAYLRLQRNLAFLDTQAMEECLDSIRDLFVTDSDCDLSTLHHLSPVIGGLWLEACIFLSGIVDSAMPNSELKAEAKRLYGRGKTFMEAHTPNNNLMKHQLAKLPDMS